MKLNEMTVRELVESVEFRKELKYQIDMENKHYEQMQEQAAGSGLRLKKAPIEKLKERGVFDVPNMVDLFERIICNALRGYSSAERTYIQQVCMMAYWRCVLQYEREKEKEKN